MKTIPALITAICLVGLGHSARATTVIAPTFDELVGQAEVIFQGTVTGVKSERIGEGGQRHIVSYVTFKVDDPVKGNPGATYTIRMLGGTVDGETMEVSDAPKFAVGDRDILFVEHNGQQFIPLVGIMHGRFHVQHDDQTGRDIVAGDHSGPLRDLSKLGKEETEAVSRSGSPTDASAPALDPAAFKAAIRAKLAVVE